MAENLCERIIIAFAGKLDSLRELATTLLLSMTQDDEHKNEIKHDARSYVSCRLRYDIRRPEV